MCYLFPSDIVPTEQNIFISHLHAITIIARNVSEVTDELRLCKFQTNPVSIGAQCGETSQYISIEYPFFRSPSLSLCTDNLSINLGVVLIIEL